MTPPRPAPARLLLPCWLAAGPALAEPAAASSNAPRALVIASTSVHAELGGPPTAQLPVGTLGQALAGTHYMARSPRRDWLQHPWVLVRTEAATGWVRGGDVAVEVGYDGPGPWVGEPVDRQVGDRTLWTAVSWGAEWEEEDPGWWREVHEGWLVVEEDEGELARLPWSESNGWGTTRGARTVAWRDLTGDGEDDAIVVFSETITEAGSAGSTVEIWDFSRAELAPLLRLPVHDPHWNGLATERAHGWVDVHLDEERLERTVVRSEACAEALPEEAPLGSGGWANSCPVLETQEWTWSTGTLVASDPAREPLRATLAAGPLAAEPEEGARVLGRAAGAQCIFRSSGPLGIGDTFQAAVGPCEGGAPLGWVPSTRLSFEAPVLAEILGLWPEDPGPYVRFDWHR